MLHKKYLCIILIVSYLDRNQHKLKNSSNNKKNLEYSIVQNRSGRNQLFEVLQDQLYQSFFIKITG